MSSRPFPAKTTHSAADPQICGLHSVTGCVTTISGMGEVPGAIRGKDTDKRNPQFCFYLTCRGFDAKPDAQIQRGTRDDDYATGFRVVPSGKVREVGKAPYTRKVPIFKWQEWRCKDDATCDLPPAQCNGAGHKGGWHDVVVWEKMVHSKCAELAGFSVPDGRTEAHRGNRTEGFRHQVAEQAESPMMDLARALDEDEAA